jgi:hypothetical protein
MTYPLAGSPTTRDQFREYCLRRLGKPVIEINVSDEQCNDRIDDALKYWMDYHCDGTEAIFYKYQLQPADFVNKYITLPPNIIGAVEIFDLGSTYGMDNMFNIRYQIALNDLYTLTSVSITPYYMAFQHLQFLEQILVGRQPIRYNRHDNIFYIDADWTRFCETTWLLVRAYGVVDPDVIPNAWGDRFLQEYATALIQEQWGQNLTKFVGMEMPGGIKFNGERLLTDAQNKITKMRDEMIHTWSLPVSDMIG